MKYRREIDGLRAVAVLPVILFHAGFSAFSGGFIGVDVFFVISGYLITTIILADKEKGKFSLVTFYERRARRILPALFFVMFCCILSAWFWLLPTHLKDFSQSLVAVSAFSSNILFWLESGYFGTASELKPLLHTWSLAVEEQYYLLFPLFIMFMWKFKKRWIFGSLMAIAVASLAAAQWGAYNKPEATFFLLPTRGWELAIGALIAFYFLYKKDHAIFVKSNKAISEFFGFVGVALIGYSIFAFDNSTPFPSFYALFPTIGTGLIIVFTTPKTLVGRFLGTKAMVGIGLISYSTYLWHQPLFVFARHMSLTEPSVSLLLALSVASIIMAYFSWRYVEMPFRDKQIVTKKRLFSFALVGSLFFSASGLAGHFGDGFSGRNLISAELRKLVRSSDVVRKSCEESLENESVVASACPVGAMNEDSSFIVFGDSHAQAIISALDEISKESNISGLNYAYNSCPPLVLGLHREHGKKYEVCSQLRNDFFQGLHKSEIPEYVIMMQRWTVMMEKIRFNNQEGGQEFGEDYVFANMYTDELGYESALEKDFVESVRMVLESGRKVVLVYPVPEVGWSVPEYLEKMLVFGETPKNMDASTSYDVFKKRNNRTYKALDSIGENENLIRVYPEKLFCDNYVAGRCVSNLDGIPLYYDDDHLSIDGARILVNDVMKKTSFFGRADYSEYVAK